jgi:hypothetical protein
LHFVSLKHLEEKDMTYEDPRTGRERNLGQDNVGASAWSWVGGLVILAAIAFGAWYFYDHSQIAADMSKPSSPTAADNSSSTPAPQQSSGPGVQGATGSTNGPAAKGPDSGSASGASTGSSGSGGNIDPATQPSQDATGVKGAEGGTNGPAPKSPGQ